MALYGAVLPANALAQCPDGLAIDGRDLESIEEIFAFRRARPSEQLNFADVSIDNANFSGRDISRICFENSQLVGSRWRNARGNHAVFHNVDLSRSDWTEFDGVDLQFVWSTLDHANLDRARMIGSEFESTSMEMLTATHADLSGGRLSGWNFVREHGPQFDFANLRGFHFDCLAGANDGCGSNTAPVSFFGADLTGADLTIGFKRNWDLSSAVISDTRITLSQLNWLRQSRVEGPVILTAGVVSAAGDFFDHSWRMAEGIAVDLTAADLRQIWDASDRLGEPGFACDRATTDMEQYICEHRYDWPWINDPVRQAVFADRDRQLNFAYRLALRRDPGIVKSQRQWIAQRDACLSQFNSGIELENCVGNAYSTRTEELWQIAGHRHDLMPGEARIYVDQGLGELLEELASHELRTRLAEPFLWNARTVTLVEHSSDGRLLARGFTIGGNYHLGGLGSPEEGMTFDEASGFYGGSDACAGAEFCPIIRFRGLYIEPGPERPAEDVFNDFIMTGARAGFSTMRQLPLDAATLRPFRSR